MTWSIRGMLYSSVVRTQLQRLVLVAQHPDGSSPILYEVHVVSVEFRSRSFYMKSNPVPLRLKNAKTLGSRASSRVNPKKQYTIRLTIGRYPSLVRRLLPFFQTGWGHRRRQAGPCRGYRYLTMRGFFGSTPRNFKIF